MDKRSKPLLSVIVPVYRAEQYLHGCVASILAQTYAPLEVVLVEDGSPDDSGRICDELAAQDTRIRVLHQKNRGQAAARNRGFSMAAGQLIAFVDSDDYIHPEMYDYLYALLEENQAQIACCGIRRVTDQGHQSYFNSQVEELLVMDRSQALRSLVDNVRITSSPCDKLFTRQVLEGRPMIEGMIYEDFEAMHRWIAAADRVVYSGRPLYTYYLTEQSTMRGEFNLRQFDSVRASAMRVAFYRQYCPEHVPAALAKHLEIGLDILYRAGELRGAEQERRTLDRELRQILRENPELPLWRNLKVKVAFFRMGTPVFRLLMDVSRLLKKTKN